MNFGFLLTAVLEVVILLSIETEAFPKSKWKFHSKIKSWHKHRNERGDGCISGTCVKAWNCPHDAVSEKPTGSCAYWSNGPWVCCTINNDINAHYPKVVNNHGVISTYKPTSVTSSPYSKFTSSSWKKTPKTTTKNYWPKEESWNIPYADVSSNRNARERPTPISALGDIPHNFRDKSWSINSENKSTKNPYDIWKETSEKPWNKQTSPYPFNTKTVSTTIKSSSDSRIIFPSESDTWSRKTTNQPTATTYSWKKTIKTFDQKSTAKVWHSTSVTKIHENITKFPQKITYSVNTRKPALSTKSVASAALDSDEWRNQNWRKSTPTYPDRRENIVTNKMSLMTSTATKRTTKRNRITTPLPNINIRLCGIREQQPIINRHIRSYNEDKPVAEAVHRDSKNRDPFQRIVGGEEAEPYSWPWVAALYKITASGGHRFLCAGSLINEKFILTAAHIFTPDDLRTARYVVMLGTHNAEDAMQEYKVSSVLQHPSYEQRYYYNDIALLQLESPVIFNDYVMPVCLPSPNAPFLSDRDLEGKNVTVMGWGDDSFGGKSSRVLKEATFPIVSRRSCNISYIKVASNRFPKGITDGMLCAGDPNGGKDACQGDSGGPLTSVEKGRHTQVGIVSFGYQCGDKEFPGVYTKVASYLSWIAENTQHIYDYAYNY